MSDPRLPDTVTIEDPRFSQDAMVVLALARTALPFARTRNEEAERWLRVMRMHGQVGGALQALGVGERPLEPPSDEPTFNVESERRSGAETVARVSALAADLARRSGAERVGTVHLLFAVLHVYGWAFDRELYRRGTSREEIFARLTTAAIGS